MSNQTLPAPQTADPTREFPAQTSVELWKRYNSGGFGSAAENELVERYLPLVKNIVGRLAMSLPSHVDQEDLYSAGLVGLLNALRRFDPTAGSTFESYARVRIRGSVFDELRRLNWAPRSIYDKARKVEEVLQRVEQEKGHIPTDAEMAKAMNLSVQEYQDLLLEIRPASFVCLDSVRGNDSDSDSSQYEAVADPGQPDPHEGVARREMARLIGERLEELPEVQRKVLALYYFEDLRLREIAEVFGVTESRICQIHAQAIHSIKCFLHRHDHMHRA